VGVNVAEISNEYLLIEEQTGEVAFGKLVSASGRRMTLVTAKIYFQGKAVKLSYE
jgi:hypothetical protein